MAPLLPQDLIKLLDLKPHPEGGFFRETYRSKEKTGGHNLSTAIYFLLPKGAVSKLHRLKSDELWHFHLGDPLTLVQIFSDRMEKETLGSKVTAGEKLQHVVPAGCWFGAYPTGAYSLVGCTVSPGFDFADFEMGDRKKLLNDFPQATEEIRKLT